MSIACIEVNGKSITPEIGTVLHQMVRQMYRDKKKSVTFECELCEGCIVLTGNRGSIHDVTGFVYDAYLSLGSFTDISRVRFIVEDRELTCPDEQAFGGRWSQAMFPASSISPEFFDPPQEMPSRLN